MELNDYCCVIQFFTTSDEIIWSKIKATPLDKQGFLEPTANIRKTTHNIQSIYPTQQNTTKQRDRKISIKNRMTYNEISMNRSAKKTN